MKGFIFSIDAMGAIAVIAVLGLAWVFLVQQETGTVGQQISRIARDSAMTNLYTGTTANESVTLTPAVPTYSYCKNYYLYNSGTISKQMKCEEMS